MKLPVPLLFDWDKGNFDKNWLKHKVSFKEAEEIFFNEKLAIFFDTDHSQKENRFMALGMTNQKRKLIISFTIRSNKIRIISARDQSRKERKLYEQETKA